MKKYFKARGLKENYDPQNKHKDIFYFAEDTGQLLLDGVSYSEATDLTPYAKAINLPDSVISNADISSDANSVTLKYTKDGLIDGGNSEVNLQIPAATTTIAGVLSAEDKVKLDTLKEKALQLPRYILGGVDWDNAYTYYYPYAVEIVFRYFDLINSRKIDTPLNITTATTKNAGVMSAPDKVKLDSLVNYQAGNGIDITGDTISCTLDTSLYSIVTELPETGLPNKIYLLPSTKTEEGNIYTEYGYVDNGWEKLGTITTEVDLSNYVQHTDVVTDTTNGLMLASDKAKLDAFEEAERYTKATNLPDSVISNVGIYNEGGVHIYIKSTKDNLIDGSRDEIKVEIPIAEKYKVGLIPTRMYNKIDGIPNAIVGEDSLGPVISVSAGNTAVWLNYNEYYFLDDSNKEINLEIPVATTELCGVMAPEDKVKLDSLVNYQAGDNIKIKDGVIKANTWIEFEMLDFAMSDSNQHTYNYNGIVIKDGSFSGSGSGIVFDKADIKYRTYTTSPNGISTVCFALNDDIRRKIDNAITSISINNIGQVNTNGAVNLTIPNATTSKEGLMSKEDKAKLDSQPTIKASDATGVTDDDYVVIKKSEYQSILDRLSALEGS